MQGNWGVYDCGTLLAEFGDDEDAHEYRRDLLELRVPEHMRCSPYDPDDLEVSEIQEDEGDIRATA